MVYGLWFMVAATLFRFAINGKLIGIALYSELKNL